MRATAIQPSRRFVRSLFLLRPRLPASTVAVVSFALALSACSGGGSSIQPSVIAESAAPSGATVAPAITQAEVRAAPLRSAAETGEASGEQARSADTFVDSIGLNTHLNWGIYHSNYPAVKAALLELGVRHIREALTLKPVPGVLDRLRDLAGAGIHTILSTNIKDDPDAIAAYAANYYPSIEAFEGPNEQNGIGDDWAPRLRAFTKNLYRAVKNNSSTARYPVLGPPLDSASNGSRDFSILGDLSAYMDEGDLHDYSGGWMPDTKFIASQVALEKVVSGNRPIVASEDGYCTATTGQSVSLETQMTYTTRMFLKQFASGFGLTMGHLLDESTNSHDFWAQCGIMTYDFQKKPTFAAIKSVIALLQDPGTSRTKSRLNYWLSDGSTKNVGHQLLQKNDGTFYLALWLDVSDYNPDTQTVLHPAAQSITINFASAPAAVTEYDFENSGDLAGRSVASHSSTARVVLTDRVKFFQIEPGSGERLRRHRMRRRSRTPPRIGRLTKIPGRRPPTACRRRPRRFPATCRGRPASMAPRLRYPPVHI